MQICPVAATLIRADWWTGGQMWWS